MNDSDIKDFLKEIKADIKDLDLKQDHQTEVLSELRVGMAKQEATIVAHIANEEQFHDRVAKIDEKMYEYNGLLAIHIEGVNQLKKTNDLLERKIDSQHAEVSQKIQKLEVPHRLVALAKQVLIASAKVLGALAAIGTFLHWLSSL